MPDTVPNYTLDDLEGRARAARRSGNLEKLEDAYDLRCKQRSKKGIVPIAILGLGRSGKDTAGEYIAAYSELVYPRSMSWAALPFIAHMVGDHPDNVWKERHLHRDFWLKACHAFRGDDYAMLARMCLGTGDMTVGIRGRLELDEVVRSKVVGLTIWIANDNVMGDETVEYGPSDCDMIVPNHGSLLEFYAKLHRFVEACL